MKFKPSVLLTLFFLAVSLGAILTALSWSPRASAGVFLACGFAFPLCLVQLWRGLRVKVKDTGKGPAVVVDVPLDFGPDSDKAQVRSLTSWAWVLGLLGAIWLVGFHLALPLYVFLYSKVHGAKWVLSLGMAAGIFGVLYGVFNKVLMITFLEPFLWQLMRG